MLQRKCWGRNRGPEAENRHGWSAERRASRSQGTRGASHAPRCAALRHTNRCLASTGRLSALRPPLAGWEIGKTRARMRRGNEMYCVLGCLTL